MAKDIPARKYDATNIIGSNAKATIPMLRVIIKALAVMNGFLFPVISEERPPGMVKRRVAMDIAVKQSPKTYGWGLNSSSKKIIKNGFESSSKN